MLRRFLLACCVALPALCCTACSRGAEERYDLLVLGGRVYDGSGNQPVVTDIAIRGDRIARIGNLAGRPAESVVDASGFAVAPGFINMLSWSVETLIEDGSSEGEIRQGVTTQIFGEGESMGPYTPEMKRRREASQGDIRYPIDWTTLAEFLRYLERRGVAQNVASFIGATTLREHAVGLEDRKATPEQLEAMRGLVRREMEEGALGIGSSLIYPPASYADTAELIELCKVAAAYRGKYISHIRSEGRQLLEAVDELIRISREAGIPAEIYHLKAAGEANWEKMDRVIEKVEQARREGLEITADMYTYTAGSTGLDACVPPWAQSGGSEKMRARFGDPALRGRILSEMRKPSDDWENLLLLAGSAERVLLVEFRKAELKPLQGKTLAEVARARGRDPAEVILDLMTEDESRVGAVYFMMSEENVRKQIGLPWVSFGSDAASMAPRGVFLRFSTHPRAYGNFARLLGRYVREERVLSLEEAIRRLTSLPARTLGLEERGLLQEGKFADLVIFDPATIADRATYENPHQFSAGVRDVVVNGRLVLHDGGMTGARPGRALWGPGRRR